MKKSVIVVAALLLASTAFAQRGPCGNRFVPQNTTGRLEAVGLSAGPLITDQRLICFIAAAPNFVKAIGPVTGLIGSDTVLIGIDFRVQDGLLYGVGDGGGIYTLSLTNAAASFVSQMNVALDGGRFGVDFNPAADRLRIISNNGQNLRVVVASGVTTEDTDLFYPPSTPAGGIAAAAYTNNDLHADTATTLFDIDAQTTADQVVIQAPPNDGSLNATGKLGVDTSQHVGLDIYSTLSPGGKALANVAYATLTVNGTAGAYLVNLLTGGAALLGNFSAQNQVTDLALPLDQF